MKRMNRLNRISAVLTAVALLLLLPFAVAAESPAETAVTPQTVYVSSGGNNATAAVGDKTKPYADFLTAYGQLTATGGTVVLLDDVTIDLNGVAQTGNAVRIYLPKSDHPIAVCGTYHEDTKAYSALCLANGIAGVCFELEGDVTFYDMIFRVQFAQNLFFAANGYALTFGFHITNETESGKAANIIGGIQNAAANVPQNPNGGATVTVFSGNWKNITVFYAAAEMNGPCNLYLYDGQFAGVYARRNTKISANQDITVHYYGGTATDKISGNINSDKTSTLICYNGAQPDNAASFTNSQTAEEARSAPDHTLNFYGTQVTAVNEGKYSVRFVGTLNSADYSAVGLLIKTASETYGGCCKNVYTSIKGNFERYTAEQLGGSYLFAWTIEDIPTGAGNVTFTVTPFLAVGETVYYGEAKTVTYQAGILQQ